MRQTWWIRALILLTVAALMIAGCSESGQETAEESEAEESGQETAEESEAEESGQETAEESEAEEGAGGAGRTRGEVNRGPNDISTLEPRFDGGPIVVHDPLTPTCDPRGILVDNEFLPIVETIFGDAFSPQNNTAELVGGATVFPEIDLDETMVAASQKFVLEEDAGFVNVGPVLAALGISPNNRLLLTPRVNGGPAVDPVRVEDPELDPEVEEARLESEGYRVLVIDSGIDPGSAWFVQDEDDLDPFIDPADLIEPYAGHGTFIAEIVARFSNNVSNITVKDLFGSKGGDPVYDADLLSLANSVAESSEDGEIEPFDAVNLSFGGYSCSALVEIEGNSIGGTTASADPADYLTPIGQRLAIERLVDPFADQGDAGAWVVAAAAGNDHTNVPFFPAAFFTAPTPDKTTLKLDSDGFTDVDEFNEIFDEFEAWRLDGRVAMDLTPLVVSVGALPINQEEARSNLFEESEWPIEYSNYSADPNSATRPWVAVEGEQGCHVSAMPIGEWIYYSDIDNDGIDDEIGRADLDSGWAWWCGTSFAAPFWLAAQLNRR